MRWGIVRTSVLCVAVAALAACAKEEHPVSLVSASQFDDGGIQPSDAIASGSGPRTCAQARSTPLPARLAAVSNKAASEATLVLASDVFDRFKEVCGQCHGPSVSLGGFQIATALDFKSAFTQSILNHVLSEGPSNPSKAMDSGDPKDPMPPFASGARLT